MADDSETTADGAQWPPAKQIRSPYAGDLVALRYGKTDDHQIFVHANLLYASSKLATMSRDQLDWTLNDGQVIVFLTGHPNCPSSPEGVAPELVSVYCHWLYTRTIDFSNVDMESLCTLDHTGDPEKLAFCDYVTKFNQLTELHILATELRAWDFLNAISDELVKLPNDVIFPGPGPLNHILFKIKEYGRDHPLMCWLIDATVPFVDDPRFMELADKFHPQWLVVVAKRAKERDQIAGSENWPNWESRCQYHTHEEGAAQCT